MYRRDRLLFLSAALVPLAAGVGANYLFAWILSRLAPETFATRTATWLELAIGMIVILAVLLLGFLWIDPKAR